MSIEEIKELMKQFQDSDINEMDVSIPELSLYLSKHKEPTKLRETSQENSVEDKKIEEVTSREDQAVVKETTTLKAETKQITSPIVGVIYTQNQPGEPAFVKKGDKIEVGDTLFIIEAMKIMNEIKSDQSGIVQEILVSNEDAVEFGQTLLTII